MTTRQLWAELEPILAGIVPELSEVSDRIAEFAEPGLFEANSSRLLAERLSAEGFEVELGVASLDTAFVARWRTARGGPAIGLMCEYDATPGDSQRPVPRIAPVSSDRGGFPDLHNGIGAASAFAAIAAKRHLQQSGVDGELVVYGTPAEKLCIGKPVLAAAGLFDGADGVVAWHPRPYTTVEWDSGPGCYQARLFDFYGRGAYAAVPWAGISALDAALLMNVGLQFMREHIPRNLFATVNELITRGGHHPTSLPSHAQVWYVSRSPTRAGIEHVDDVLTRCAEAACVVTGARYQSALIAATRPWLPNHVMAEHCYASLEIVGAPTFPVHMKDFGREMLAELGRTSDDEPFDENLTLPQSGVTSEFAGGADDVTEFSWHAPTARIYVAHGLKGSGWPSWTGAALASSAAAHETIRVAASAVALSVIDLLSRPTILEKAKREFEMRTAEGRVPPLLPSDWELPPSAIVPS